MTGRPVDVLFLDAAGRLLSTGTHEADELVLLQWPRRLHLVLPDAGVDTIVVLDRSAQSGETG